jgi:HD-like signal output (HDOD) protein
VKRILFVDDQPEILSAHRAAMKKYRGQVDTIFEVTPEAALQILREMHVDVVVSDMHMPRKNGPALLAVIKELHPDVVRIMLCPPLETDSVLLALPVSHQVLAKPLDADVLWNAIERIYRLRALLTDTLRKKIGGLKQLPSVPTVYMDMMAAMARPDMAMVKIARIIEQDAAMATKTLQLVNSVCFGLPKSVTSIDQAVSYLGMDLVRDLSLTINIFSALEPTASRAGFSFTGEQEHALIVAKVARRLVSGRRAAQNAFTASLLHDVGKLVLAVCMPEQFKQVMHICSATGRPSHEVESEMLGMTHAEVGAYLLGLWGLPYSIVEAVAYHHNPSGALERTFDTPTAVSVANALVEHFTVGKPLTLEHHLASLNVLEKLPQWTAIAQEEIEQTLPKYAEA